MIWAWVIFVGFILFLLALDLGVFHRHASTLTMRQALGWSAAWISLGLSFSALVYFAYEGRWLGLGTKVDVVDGTINDGFSAMLKYLTGYVVEQSLSVDNVFVIAMLFIFFGVPAIYQRRVLFWGILGALLMRGLMITVGAALITRFHWILYLFGGFLVITAFKMLSFKPEEVDPSHNVAVRLARRFFPVTNRFHGEHFLVRAGASASREAAVPEDDPLRDEAVEKAAPGTLMLTPLALALITVETTDLVFAVDSIPAIFAITADPFLVFTSNAFAILGLRSLYFVVAGMMNKFRYLKVSLALVLMLVGVKMLVADWLRETIGPNFSFYLLGMVVLILAGGVVASWLANKREERAAGKG